MVHVWRNATSSRLLTVIELLRDTVRVAEADPQQRMAELGTPQARH
jgi:hypothetical protein